MTSHAAAVVPGQLIDVFDHVPEYVDYDHADTVRDRESGYRIALGKVAKSWGDQLLDLAEHPGSRLTRAEIRTIDALLEKISEVFAQLNAFDLAELDPGDRERRHRLREVDAVILDIVEDSASLMRDLRRAEGATLWLNDNAGPLYRRLRRLALELEQRNDVLGGRPSRKRTARVPRRQAQPARKER